MTFREINAVYCENDKKHRNTVCGQNVESLMLKQAIYAVTTGLHRVKF
jgi:hypothetical protein